MRKTVKDELAFLVAFVGVPRKIYARDSQQNARKAEQKVSQNYPSCTWSWPLAILFVCSFSPTPSVVFLVAAQKCMIPGRNPLDESWAMNSIAFKKLMDSKGCITMLVEDNSTLPRSPKLLPLHLMQFSLKTSPYSKAGSQRILTPADRAEYILVGLMKLLLTFLSHDIFEKDINPSIFLMCSWYL